MIKIITGKRDSGKTSYLRYLVRDSKFFNGFLEYKKYDEHDERSTLAHDCSGRISTLRWVRDVENLH